MVGRAILATLDLRYQDIFIKNEHFVNVSVVLVGDMYQLPLVIDSLLYIKDGNLMQQNERIANAGFNRCVVLSQIFR